MNNELNAVFLTQKTRKGFLRIVKPFAREGRSYIILDDQIVRAVKDLEKDREVVAIYNARVFLTEHWEYRKSRGVDALRLCWTFKKPSNRERWLKRTHQTVNRLKRRVNIEEALVLQ